METSVDLLKHSIQNTGGWSRKKHGDTSGCLSNLFIHAVRGMYEEVDDSGRDERFMQRERETVTFSAPFSLTTPLRIQCEAHTYIYLNKLS